MNQLKKCVIFSQRCSHLNTDLFFSLEEESERLGEYAVRKGLEIEKIFSITWAMKNRHEILDDMLEYASYNKINIIVIGTNHSLTKIDMIIIDTWLNGQPSREIHIAKTGQVYTQKTDPEDKIDWDSHVYMAKLYFRHHCENLKKFTLLEKNSN